VESRTVIRFLWAHQGSNLGPLACKASALPLSYAPGPPGTAGEDGIPARVPVRAGSRVRGTPLRRGSVSSISVLGRLPRRLGSDLAPRDPEKPCPYTVLRWPSSLPGHTRTGVLPGTAPRMDIESTFVSMLTCGYGIVRAARVACERASS
jgi:hypothetical protein